jgi:hypothetical protein
VVPRGAVYAAGLRETSPPRRSEIGQVFSWTSILVQQLIQSKFEVLYNRYYVCELLPSLGFSVQKARFVSDRLDEEARQRWWADTWLQINRLFIFLTSIEISARESLNVVRGRVAIFPEAEPLS